MNHAVTNHVQLQTLNGTVLLKYEVDDDLVVIFAVCANRTVGRLTGLFDSGAAHLQDVVVEDSMPIKRGLLDCLSGRTRTRSFRGHGIGSTLLNEFLTICRSRNVSHAIGAVVQHDLDATSGLLNWYARHGFQKRVPSESPLPGRFRPPNTIWEVVWTPPVPASE
jgi:GNAT superfamily N-acetyltransferase